MFTLFEKYIGIKVTGLEKDSTNAELIMQYRPVITRTIEGTGIEPNHYLSALITALADSNLASKGIQGGYLIIIK